MGSWRWESAFFGNRPGETGGPVDGVLGNQTRCAVCDDPTVYRDGWCKPCWLDEVNSGEEFGDTKRDDLMDEARDMASELERDE